VKQQHHVTRTIRVPVVKDNRDVTPPAPAVSTSSAAATPNEPTAPIVTSSVGVEPPSFGDGTPADAAGAPAIVSSSVGVDPSAFREPQAPTTWTPATTPASTATPSPATDMPDT